MKVIFLSVGVFFVGLAFVGVFVPVLPTTPFLLVSCFCFTRSSERFMQRLRDSKYFGPYIEAYYDKKGLSNKEKYRVYLVMWPMMMLSAYLVNNFHLRIFLMIVMVGVTIYIWRLPDKVE